MPVSPEFRDYLLEMLESLGAIVARRMFSGVGLFRHGVMFAYLVDDTVYLKTSTESRRAFKAAGSRPFVYSRTDRKRGLPGYWRLPDEVLEDADALLEWVAGAIEVAFDADAAKPPSKRRRAGPA